MKRSMSLAALAALLMVGSVLADDKADCGKKDKAGCAKSTLVSGKSGCSKACDAATAGVLASMPQMTYKAGDLETPCFKTATKKAGCESKVNYVVAGKSYDCKREASASLAGMLEKHLEQMMTVSYTVNGDRVGCPDAAKQMATAKNTKVMYRLAGVDFASQARADAASKAVHEAVANLAKDQGVKTCPVTGKELASGSDCCSKAKAVAGKDKSDCAKSCAGKNKADCAKACASKAKTASGDAKGEGCCSKAKTVAGKDKAGCSKSCGSKATTVAGNAKAGCSEKCDKECPNVDAEKRLAQVQDMLRVVVETAAKSQAS